MQTTNTEKKWTNIETYPKNVGKLSRAELEKVKGEKWYVRFRYFDEGTGKWVLVRRMNKINRVASTRERIRELHALKAAVVYKLEVEGWNPLTGKTESQAGAAFAVGTPVVMASINELMKMTFAEAIDFAFDQKKVDLAKKSRDHYTTAIKYFKEAAATIAVNSSGRLLRDELMVSLHKAHYKILLDHVQRLRKLDAKGFNKYRSSLSGLVRELTELTLEKNLVADVSKKVVIDKASSKHKPPDATARKIIIDNLRANHFAYYRFLCVLYSCAIRPKEICALRIKEIDWENQEFIIPYDLLRGNLKVKKERRAAIPDWLIEVLKEMNLRNYNPEWYIFSCNGKRGGAFLPGERMMHPNTSCDYWKKIVKVGLGYNCTQYSLKKLGGNDMVKMQRREGINRLLELPREQMGHTSTKTTEIYVDEHLEVMREFFKRKMPVL